MMIPTLSCAVSLAAASLAADNPWADGFTAFRTGRYGAAVTPLEQIAESGPAENGARALLMLASMARVRGETEQAAAYLHRLLEKYPRNHWASRGAGDLVDLRLAQDNHEQAMNAIERFLAVYLETRFSTVDDPSCTRMFTMLVDCQRALSPGLEDASLLQTLRDSFYTPSEIGRVVALHAGVDPRRAGENLVLNGDFELDGKALGTPVGWTYRGTEPELFNDFDGVITGGGQGELIRAAGGDFCAGKFTSYGRHRGWLFQRVPVIAGRRYQVSARGMTPAQEGSPGTIRMGVDLTGGDEPESDRVHWSQPLSNEKEYVLLEPAGDQALAATGDALTVFLEIRQDTVAAPNAMLFDDVIVREAGRSDE